MLTTQKTMPVFPFSIKLDSDLPVSYRKPAIDRSTYQDYVESVNQYEGETPNKTKSKLAIVIVAYNEGDELLRCIDSLVTQSTIPGEIILVDNGLDDATKKAINKYSLIHVVTNTNVGCSSGRNIGSAYVTLPLVAFVDADGYVDSNFCEVAVRSMADESVVAIRGKVKPINTDGLYDGLVNHYDLGAQPIVSFIDTEGDSVFRTQAYRAAGGYEDCLAGGEGLVLTYRMVEFYGHNHDAFRYEPDLILFHDFYQDEEHFLKKYHTSLIVNYKLQTRYPYLDELKKYYYALRSTGAAKTIANEAIASIVSKRQQIQREFNEERDRHYEYLKLRRANLNLLDADEKPFQFTVVIPCYNLGVYLKQALDSVLSQTLEGVEIIIVDDASNDPDTQKLLDQLETKLQVVKLEENSGVSVARNTGIQLAKSDYVLCLDADDHIHPLYLESAKSVFDAYPDVGIVSCYMQTTGEESWKMQPAAEISVQQMLTDCPLPTGSCFRKQASVSSGGYDPGLRGYEDWDHWIRIFKSDWKVKVIPKTLFYYFCRVDSKVKTSNKNAKTLIGRIIENHQELYEKHFSEVIAEKHEKLASLRGVVKSLPKTDAPSGGTSNQQPDTTNKISGIFRRGVNTLVKLLSNSLFVIGVLSLLAINTIVVIGGVYLEALSPSQAKIIAVMALNVALVMGFIIWFFTVYRHETYIQKSLLEHLRLHASQIGKSIDTNSNSIRQNLSTESSHLSGRIRDVNSEIRKESNALMAEHAKTQNQNLHLENRTIDVSQRITNLRNFVDRGDKSKIRLGHRLSFANVDELLGDEYINFMSPYSGLTDRLMQFGAMLTLSASINKKLRVFWPLTKYCNESLKDYFELPCEYIDISEEECSRKGIAFCNDGYLDQDLTGFGENIIQYELGSDYSAVYNNFRAILQSKHISSEDFRRESINRMQGLSLRAPIKRKIEEFIDKNFSDEMVGIHVRRTDKIKSTSDYFNISESDIDLYDRLSIDLIDKQMGDEVRFFLACDDSKYKEKIITHIESYGYKCSSYSHHNSEGFRQTTLENTIIDLYLLSRCDKVLRCGPSGFAEIGALLGDKPIETINPYIELSLESSSSLPTKNRTNYEHIFSVVVTCYNIGELLVRCINSVKQQTLEKVEIILVDDASTDPVTTEILENIDDNVTLLRHPYRSGVSEARNTGIRAANSPYILCLDGDDYIDTSYLHKAQRIFDKSPDIGIVSCYLQAVGDESWTHRPPANITMRKFLSANPLPSASCFRRDASLTVGLYDPTLPGYEDWDHWLRLYENGWSVEVIPERLFFYYRRSGSRSTKAKHVDYATHFIEKHKELYQKDFTHVIAEKQFVAAQLASRLKIEQSKKITPHAKSS